MTGFSITEERVGRLVGRTLELGVAPEVLGILPGDKRTVGPAATLQAAPDGRGCIYRVNSTNGVTLGRNYNECFDFLRGIVAAHQASNGGAK